MSAFLKVKQPGRRGCGTRKQGGIYLSAPMKPGDGICRPGILPGLGFVFDPFIPLSPEAIQALGVNPRGVTVLQGDDPRLDEYVADLTYLPHFMASGAALVERGAADSAIDVAKTMFAALRRSMVFVIDWVGATHYPTPAAFVAEMAAQGLSRRIHTSVVERIAKMMRDENRPYLMWLGVHPRGQLTPPEGGWPHAPVCFWKQLGIHGHPEAEPPAECSGHMWQACGPMEPTTTVDDGCGRFEVGGVEFGPHGTLPIWNELGKPHLKREVHATNAGHSANEPALFAAVPLPKVEVIRDTNIANDLSETVSGTGLTVDVADE